MTNKEKTVSKRYNSKKRYNRKKLTNKKKRGGAAAEREETLDLNKLVLRFVLDQEANRHRPDELKKYLISYLRKGLFSIFKNGASFKDVTIEHPSPLLFFVQIPKDQWTEKTYQKYKEHVEELFDTIKLGRPGGTRRIHWINDEESIYIQEMTIDKTWIKEEDAILRLQRAFKAKKEKRRI